MNRKVFENGNSTFIAFCSQQCFGSSLIREPVFFITHLKRLSPGPGAKQVPNKYWGNECRPDRFSSVVWAVSAQARSPFCLGCSSPSSHCSASNSSHLKSSPKDYPWATGTMSSRCSKSKRLEFNAFPLVTSIQWLRSRNMGLSCFKAAQTCQCNLQARTPCRIRPRPGLHLKLHPCLAFYAFLYCFPCSLVGLPLRTLP